MSAFFVAATGTDIGKTFVTAGLVRALRRRGCPVAALKPVVSGFDPSAPAGSDPAVLLEALGRPVTPEEVERISPWQYRASLSPDMAARAEGRPLDVDAVVAFCREQIAAADGVLLVEGVGGVMVPLDQRRTVLDWMAALGLPTLLVAGSYLGTISHTLTALDVLARRGVAVRTLVVSETAGATVPLDETMTTLSHFVGDIPMLDAPRTTDRTALEPVFDRLAGQVLGIMSP